MFIQTEDTPNPDSIKFIPGVEVSPGKPTNFTSSEECSKSPLAEILFSLGYINGVFFGNDFITITKKTDKDWTVIKAEILLTLMEYFSSNKKVMIDDVENTIIYSADDDNIVKQIKEIIEHKVRPAVAQDGGDIIFHSFEEGIVKLELHGACSGCPSSTVTLKNGIENMLKHYVPEVKSVEAVS